MSVFRLKMLPASEGDCLILSYGPSEDSLAHIVIDGGRIATWPALSAELQAIKDRGEEVELMVLSHIDADHIDGLLAMAEDGAAPLAPKSVWYNGFDQLARLNTVTGVHAFGYKAADAYSRALKKLGWPINAEFDGNPIFLDGPPKSFGFAGLTLTLLSPDRAKLDRLREGWNKYRRTRPTEPMGASGIEVVALGKRPFPDVLDVEVLSRASKIDTTAPNGSSISLVAEYHARRVLLGADAHPDLLVSSLSALAGPNGTYPVNLIKLPHHGSRANVTRQLVELVATDRYAFSTSGAVFGHPDPEAVARILKFGAAGPKTLYFNYDGPRTRPWEEWSDKPHYNYTCVFPATPETGLTIDI